ncbi:MAG: hypothetical protein AB3N33_05340 [Puniceicoccaceae bacterium]
MKRRQLMNLATLRMALVSGVLACVFVPAGFAGIVDVGPPTGVDDYALLQGAIIGNPGEMLMLQQGTYEMGGNMLVIPHGLTLVGQKDGDGALLTTINSSADYGIFVNCIGASANDEVVFKDLAITTYGPVIAQLPLDMGTMQFVPGGGNLTVDGCYLENQTLFTIMAHRLDDTALRVRNSELVTHGDDCIRLNFSSYSVLEVDNCVLDLSEITNPNIVGYWDPDELYPIVFPQDGVEVLNGYIGWEWLSWQTPDDSEAYITNNTMLTGNPFVAGTQATRGMGFNLLHGTALIEGNTIHVPVAGGGMTFDDLNYCDDVLIKNNTIHGSPEYYGTYSNAVELVGLEDPKGKTGGHVKFMHNKLVGHFAVAVDAYFGVYKNTFVNNDFSEATMNGFAPWGIVPVHYSFFYETGKNSVTDSSGGEITYSDYPDANHFQGNATFIRIE